MAFGASGSPVGGSLPTGQSPYPWLSNWLGGFGIPSGTSSNGLPQIGLPQGGFQGGSFASAPTMAQPGMGMSPLPNSMGQPGGGMMGMPFWMQMLGLQRPQAQPVPQPQPLSPLLSQPQVRAPTPAAAPAPAPAAPAAPTPTSWQGTPIGPTQQAQLQQFNQQNPAYASLAPQQLYNMMTYGNIQGDQNQAFQGR